AALAGFDVLELDDLENRAVDVDMGPVAELVGRNHPRASVVARLLSDDQVLVDRAENLATVVGDDDEVLDPDPEAAGKVDARLARDRVARRQHVVGSLRQPRVFVDLETDPM